MTDLETTAAIEALAHRVKARDKAIRDGEEYPDAEPFALEFLTALLGQGWRMTNAAPAPVHQAGPGLPKSADAVAAVAELRARLAARAPAEPEDGAA